MPRIADLVIALPNGRGQLVQKSVAANQVLTVKAGPKPAAE